MVSATPLQEDLERFVQTAARLEGAYSELQRHARRVDRELAEKNRQLQNSLREKECILELLPMAVFRAHDQQEAARRWVPVNASAHALIASHGQVPKPTAADPQSPGRFEERGIDGKLRCFEARELAAQDGPLLFLEDRSPWITMEAELERLERLGGLAELALGIAHEIRNPLNGLTGFASMLRRSPHSPRAEHWAQRIEEGAKRVERTVRDLLNFARPDAKAPAVARPLQACLSVAAREVLLDIDPELAKQRVLVAPRAFEQVLANLARNARQAGATRIAVCELGRTESKLRLRFSDNGPGVDAAIATRIFDPFVGTKEEGTGLGLAFASRAMTRMGGALRLVDAGGPAKPKELVPACFELEVLLANDEAHALEAC